MYLMNMSNQSYDLQKFNSCWLEVKAFLDKHKLDGLEMIVDGEDNLAHSDTILFKGLHLKYFPTWLDFYKGNLDAIRDIYATDEKIRHYYGGLTKNAMIDHYKEAFEKAKSLGVHYMVFHVAHIQTKDAFTFEYDYSDDDVLDATADLINECFTEDSEIDLLFENLWWPGMTLLDQNKTKRFLDKIKYKNKGIMLDLSHLMITNPDIKDLDHGTDYILEVIENLGETSSYIKGIHINKSLPNDYLKKNHIDKYYEVLASDGIEKYIKLMSHIKRIDWHVPYDHKGIQAIINRVNPKYVVYEVLSNNIDQLDAYIKLQNQMVGR